MLNGGTKSLGTYSELFDFIRNNTGVDAADCDSQYYPFCQSDPTQGFLELILPVADSRGRLLRGAAGNGPIFIFLYRRGRWSYLGEMHGTQVTADTASRTTEFTVYSHASASSGVQRRYSLQGERYECVAEEEVTNEPDKCL